MVQRTAGYTELPPLLYKRAQQIIDNRLLRHTHADNRVHLPWWKIGQNRRKKVVSWFLQASEPVFRLQVELPFLQPRRLGTQEDGF